MTEPFVAETVADILHAYRTGVLAPDQVITRTFARIRAHADPAVFITLRAESDALSDASALMRDGNKELPLFGIPIAIKDNIDVAGLPTTAGCPASGT